MKILHVTTVGVTARVFLLPVLQRLRQEGYDVHLACTPDEDARRVAAEGFPLFPCPISRSISPSDLWAVRRLRRFVEREGFDLVHTHTAKAGFVGRTAAWLAGVPCIMHTYHGMPIHPYQPRIVSSFYTRLERWIGRRTTHFVAVTEKLKTDIVTLGIAPEEKITRIYNGLSFARFNPNGTSPPAAVRQKWQIEDDALVIGVVSRLVPHKGLDDLLAAFAQMASSHPAAHLVIAGEGELRPDLEAHAETLGVSHRVHWLGWQDDVPRILSGFDIFCLPTLREGFGYVFLEAQAMGLPVVATRIDPLTETMKEDETALLVPPHSPAELAAALSRLINDEDLRTKLGTSGRHRVRGLFDQRIQLDQLSALYDEVRREM